MRSVFIRNSALEAPAKTAPPSAGRLSVAQAAMQLPDSPAQNPVAKSCRKAVERAYWSMVNLGYSHFQAFRVADRVLQWHRPLASDFNREVRIRCWINGRPMR